MDDTFTVEEVEDILKDIDAMVETEVETELFGAARTNVLLLQQIFLQAQKWHLDLDADLSTLENRYSHKIFIHVIKGSRQGHSCIF